MKTLLAIFITASLLIADSPNLTRESLKKLEKSVSELYSGRKVTYAKLNLADTQITDPDILNSDGKWFAIRENSNNLGWLLADKTWGRYHEFEFAIVFDTSLRIADVFVLSYPASYGTAVTGRKWLKSFRGFSPDSIPVYGQDIDALSGATFSGTNLSESVAGSLVILEKLEQADLLK
ncbi:MAG: hypothetical protein HGA37_05800 [Lentimicrobium sp.]|nr:hypothetical protein [Lentimicrobium sp.]